MDPLKKVLSCKFLVLSLGGEEKRKSSTHSHLTRVFEWFFLSEKKSLELEGNDNKGTEKSSVAKQKCSSNCVFAWRLYL
jgi:hypothetical protein